MTQDEHRAEALRLMDAAKPYPEGPLQVASPERLAVIAEAQLHATLAITAPTTKPTARKRTATAKVAESKGDTK